jgi:hypothetical protein
MGWIPASSGSKDVWFWGILTRFGMRLSEIQSWSVERYDFFLIRPEHWSLASTYVLALTLVDLPGLTKDVTKPNAIIPAVTAGNTDIANSDGIAGFY